MVKGLRSAGEQVAESVRPRADETRTSADVHWPGTRSDAHGSLGVDSLDLDSEALPSGSVVCGKFRVLGAQRTVGEELAFKALHLGTGRRVELRLLAPGSGANSPEAERMLRAARAAGRAPHANVLNVVDSGFDLEQRPFVVYEQFAGVPCAEIVRARGAFDVRTAADVVAQVLDGLSALHGRGVYHRQIRPEHVLVDGSSHELRVKLVGLGHAVQSGQEASAPELPRGHLRYLAPEARRGDVVASASIDLYATGVLLRYLLTGDTAQGAELPPVIEQTLTRALANDPDERFADAAQFRACMAAIAGPSQRDSLLPSDSLQSDLRFMRRRRDAQERENARIATRVTPVDLGRFELYAVLLIIEAVYARAGAFGWSMLTAELPQVEELLPAAGHADLLSQRGVSAALVTELLAHADRVMGKGDLRSLLELGEELARRGLARLCAALPAQLTPEILVACVPALWRSLLRDGEVSASEEQGGRARVTVRHQLAPSLEISVLFASLLRGQLALLSPHGEVNLVACHALGDGADVYQLSW